MAGESIGYFDFYPVQQPENEQDWGRVPTWGTCTVVSSKCAFVPKGQRVYGLVPLSKYFVATPKPPKQQEANWMDAAPHRQKRDVIYNTYSVLEKDPMYAGPSLEDAMILVRPLFLTAWLLREAVLSIPLEQLLITSASSKTGASLAALMKKRRDETGLRIKIIGMTSPSNVSYCNSLGYYDEVIPYSPTYPMEKLVIVDMAGKLDLLRGIQANLKDSLVKIISVGMTHVEEVDMGATFSGEGFNPKYAKPEFFFAPKYAGKVLKADPLALTQAVPRDWHDFIQNYPLNIQRCTSAAQVASVLNDFASGKIPGDVSWVGSWNSASAL